MSGAWAVYILQCADGSLYTGITNNLPQRLDQHAAGTGAKYTRGRGPFVLVYHEDLKDRSAASKRERDIKKMNRRQKLTLTGLSG